MEKVSSSRKIPGVNLGYWSDSRVPEKALEFDFGHWGISRVPGKFFCVGLRHWREPQVPGKSPGFNFGQAILEYPEKPLYPNPVTGGGHGSPTLDQSLKLVQSGMQLMPFPE